MKKGFMKKLTVYFMIAMLAFSTASGSVYAHSGRTDSSGGHKDNKNASGLGAYHYHCGGYPPHLHEKGVCPYTSSGTVETTSVAETTQTSTATTSSETSKASGKIVLSSETSITISKDIIKIVQDVLNQKGYDCGTVDGSAGEKTKAALKKYLDEHKESDGADCLILQMVAEGLGIE